MGFLIAGLALLAGLFAVGRARSQADAAAPMPARVGLAAVMPAVRPKCRAGQIVAVLPHACWGEVTRVAVGRDGRPRYRVALQTGPTVEVLGREIC